MRAFLKNNRQAPRKVRLLARTFVGKQVTVAISELSFMPHKAAETLRKLVASAAANAKMADTSLTDELLTIKNITVDKGITYKRYMPRAFGRAAPIRKECSHILVELATKITEKAKTVKKEVVAKKSDVVIEKKTEKKTVKKVTEKKESEKVTN
jgi:large subunit ribosomal protein L22